jgi:hypothetical protein
MNKDELITKVSLSIDWERICDHLEYELDIEINPDCYTFKDIETTVTEMLLEALKEEPNFTYKY